MSDSPDSNHRRPATRLSEQGQWLAIETLDLTERQSAVVDEEPIDGAGTADGQRAGGAGGLRQDGHIDSAGLHGIDIGAHLGAVPETDKHPGIGNLGEKERGHRSP